MWTSLLDGMLGRLIRNGELIVTYPNGKVRRYGRGAPHAAVHLKDETLVRRLVLHPDLALGEGYMDGNVEVEGDDLEGLLALAMQNMEDQPANWRDRLLQFRSWFRWVDQFNPMGRAQRNVAHHYDLSGELYDLFLDKDRQYSCAYFSDPAMTLEEAQEAKKQHIAKKLLIEPGMRVLDIGCGWGGLGLTLARDFGAQVVGVTLSTEQHKIACQRAKDAGLEGQVDFRLTDYRNVTERFDRVVSVGMFEHVGVPHYREYFRNVHDRLTEDGVALIHFIGRMSPPGSTSPWILKYIFPGGYVPALSETMAAVEKEHLWATDVEVWRLHYAETLKNWRARFMANRDKAKALYDERFCRMWRYYLSASEMSFRHFGQNVFQIQLARRQEAVPLTRNYLYPAEAKAARRSRANVTEAAE
ncbi:SAM-dependent methyltransferase [Solirhodobacter olei]|uniref:SAM-dependent methyltransferase n=1 Tax=Solirhodobacter olei TaxID=2493082 RepID=UPI000FD89939|nr:cyclopropane-fatty-acyl-phospholipid synthase family protein [Solirhodobacter olei]